MILSYQILFYIPLNNLWIFNSYCICKSATTFTHTHTQIYIQKLIAISKITLTAQVKKKSTKNILIKGNKTKNIYTMTYWKKISEVTKIYKKAPDLCIKSINEE